MNSKDNEALIEKRSENRIEASDTVWPVIYYDRKCCSVSLKDISKNGIGLVCKGIRLELSKIQRLFCNLIIRDVMYPVICEYRILWLLSSKYGTLLGGKLINSHFYQPVDKLIKERLDSDG